MHIHDSISTEKNNGSRGVHHILDVTFVDDECIMLAADDPESFPSAIDCCTRVLSTTFQLLKSIGVPGKTECLIQMVGKLGRDIVVKKWRCDDGLSIPVRQSDMRINVVDRYRHLGTIVMANGNDVPNAHLRAKSAKESCAGVAHFRDWVHSYPAEAVTVHVLGRVSQLLFDAHCTTVIERPSDCCFCVQPRIAQDSCPTV